MYYAYGVISRDERGKQSLPLYVGADEAEAKREARQAHESGEFLNVVVKALGRGVVLYLGGRDN